LNRFQCFSQALANRLSFSVAASRRKSTTVSRRQERLRFSAAALPSVLYLSGFSPDKRHHAEDE
jgi:hypothetical protein